MRDTFFYVMVFLLLSTNANGQTIVRYYDSLGRMTQEIYPDSSSITYAYDNMGNLIRQNVHDPCSTKPKPVVTGPLAFCAGDSVFLSTFPGFKYVWSTGDTTQTIKVKAGGNYAVIRTDTFRAYLDTIQCSITSDSFMVTMKPLPNVNPIPNQAKCKGDLSDSVNFSGSIPGTGYFWQNDHPSIGIIDTGSGNILPFTLIDTSSLPIVASFSVTPTASGCTGPIQTFTITASPIPNVVPVSSQTVCGGVQISAINFSGAVPGTAFNWTNNNISIGLTDTGTGNILPFIAQDTLLMQINANIVVTPVAFGCAGTSDTFAITVNPSPKLTSSLSLLLPAAARSRICFPSTLPLSIQRTDSLTFLRECTQLSCQ